MDREEIGRKFADTITPGNPDFDPLFCDDMEALVVERLRAKEPLNAALKAHMEMMQEGGMTL